MAVQEHQADTPPIMLVPRDVECGDKDAKVLALLVAYADACRTSMETHVPEEFDQLFYP